ncbi:unnamed protein product, partial [Ranitomeya imitator]
MFEDNYFLQTKGTAMGSNVAPPYANSCMAKFEEEIVYPTPLFQSLCPVWKHYIDYVFCIWSGTSQTLDQFFHNLIQHGRTSPLPLQAVHSRVRKIITDPLQSNMRTDEMYKKFRERSYPPDLLANATSPSTLP